MSFASIKKYALTEAEVLLLDASGLAYDLVKSWIDQHGYEVVRFVLEMLGALNKPRSPVSVTEYGALGSLGVDLEALEAMAKSGVPADWLLAWAEKMGPEVGKIAVAILGAWIKASAEVAPVAEPFVPVAGDEQVAAAGLFPDVQATNTPAEFPKQESNSE